MDRRLVRKCGQGWIGIFRPIPPVSPAQVFIVPSLLCNFALLIFREVYTKGRGQMKSKTNIVGLTCAAMAWVFMSVSGVMPLRAQTGGALAGNVVDQAGKPVEGAVASAIADGGNAVSGTATADSKGHFAI